MKVILRRYIDIVLEQIVRLVQHTCGGDMIHAVFDLKGIYRTRIHRCNGVEPDIWIGPHHGSLN